MRENREGRELGQMSVSGDERLTVSTSRPRVSELGAFPLSLAPALLDGADDFPGHQARRSHRGDCDSG
jgi:hypothetical protein